MKKINAKLDAELATAGAFLDAKYMCFHHPDSGFPGEVPSLKFDCDCRKPKPGMIYQAQRALNIDLTRSWFIGDSTLDFGAAANAGVTSIGVRTGQGSVDGLHPFDPDVMVDDFAAAVDFITQDYPTFFATLKEYLPALSDASEIYLRCDDDHARGYATVIRRHITSAVMQPATGVETVFHNQCGTGPACTLYIHAGQVTMAAPSSGQDFNA